jgi:PAS domain S-box-containing protein
MAQVGDEQPASVTAAASAPCTLTVLHVEDSEDDALLVTRELRRGGYVLRCERVQSAEAMAAALARQNWDVVLSDHDMPAFSAPAALNVLQHSGRDIPFIVVTGAVGEEFAAGLMKAGAHDFIKKSNLARLLPAIERELREAAIRRERRQTEEALRESEERLQLALDGSDIGLWEFDIATGRSRYSTTWRRLFGYGDGELTGSLSEWRDLVHPDDCKRLDAFVASHLRAALLAPYTTEFRIRHRDGSYRWVLSRARILVDATNKPTRMLGVHVDITARRQAEQALRESEARYRVLFETAPDPTGVFDADLRVVMVNHRAARLFGFDTPEQMVGHSGFEFVAPEGAPRLQAELGRVLAGGSPVLAEWAVLTRTGTRFLAEATIAGVPDSQGWPQALIVVCRDISRRKEAEEALRESEERYRVLVENLNDSVFTVNAHGRFVYVSPAMERTFGYAPAEVLGRHFSDFVHPSDLPDLLASMARTAAGQLEPSEYRVFDKAGAIRFVRSSSRPLHEDGTFAGFSGVITDITERKEAEAALRLSEERFAKAFRASPAPMSLARHQDGIIVDVNDSFLKLTGYTREELIGEAATAVGIVTETERVARNALLAQGPIRDLEVRLRTKSGADLVVLASMETIELSGVTCNLGIAVDITERKRAEQELRASEERYRQLVELCPEAIAVDRGGTIAFVNSAAVRLLGATSAADVLGKPIMSFVHRDFHALVADHIRELAADPTVARRAEEKLVRLDGTVLDVEVAATAITYEGQPAAQLVVHDLGAYKRALAAMVDSPAVC